MLFIPDFCQYFPTYTNLIGNKKISKIFVAPSSSLVVRVLVAFTLYPSSAMGARIFHGTSDNSAGVFRPRLNRYYFKKVCFFGRPKKKETHTRSFRIDVTTRATDGGDLYDDAYRDRFREFDSSRYGVVIPLRVRARQTVPGKISPDGSSSCS